ncbi:hypothetical protein Taro_056751 [Colocasia esculenta]|uniref:Retrotransposon gag domain-containing protein n=1 Tax=Colocasia esculenta TaxID=4460 RepID=A0A843XUQ4_COLES|nr:hypothetical protein [Colocasia esculenta]
MQTQAHTQAALQAQMESQERADVWWASLLHTRFEDGAIDVAWDEFVRLFRAKFVPKHIQDRMEQEFLSLTQGSKTVLEYEARKAKKFVMSLMSHSEEACFKKNKSLLPKQPDVPVVPAPAPAPIVQEWRPVRGRKSKSMATASEVPISNAFEHLLEVFLDPVIYVQDQNLSMPADPSPDVTEHVQGP